MTLMTALLFVAGIVLLTAGAEALVRGASRLAIAAGLTPVVVGLTVVAVGTSSPELAVSIGAAVRGQADVSLGNVIGSNVFNVLLILGLCAAVLPLIISPQILRSDLWMMLAVSFLPLVLGREGLIDRTEGILMLGALGFYTVYTVRQGRREQALARAAEARLNVDVAPQESRRHVGRDILLIIFGLAMLVAGAKWLVDGAVSLARTWGVSEMVIGLTIVAAGTSLPEVATSVIATLRGQRDIAVGNVVGSNIFNILGVLGASAAFSRGGVAVGLEALRVDIPIMIAVAAACVPVFFTARRMSRGEGLLFLAYYLAYTTYLILHARQSPELWRLRDAVLHLALPATALILLVTVIQSVLKKPVPQP